MESAHPLEQQPFPEPGTLPPATNPEARRLRNEWLDGLLDPNQALPPVSLVEDPTVLYSGLPEPDKTGYRAYNSDGQPVGQLRLATASDPNNPAATIEKLTWIQADVPNQGYGKAMYVTLLKTLPETATLVSSNVLQPGALKVWQWLASRHVATQTPGKLRYNEDRGYTSNEHNTPLFVSVIPTSEQIQKATAKKI